VRARTHTQHLDTPSTNTHACARTRANAGNERAATSGSEKGRMPASPALSDIYQPAAAPVYALLGRACVSRALARETDEDGRGGEGRDDEGVHGRTK